MREILVRASEYQGPTTSDVRSAVDGVYHSGYHPRLGESTLKFGTTLERSHQHFSPT